MANLFDWYFEQLVSEDEMDEAFANIEASIQNLIADQSYYGVYLGLGVTEATVPDLTVDIAGGRAYDQNGQRIYVPTTQNLDVSVDSNSASTAVAVAGNEKWVSVFIRYTRALSDQRFDGNGSPVYFRRDESFEFVVEQGAEALIGTAARPALRSDAILIADINLVNGQTQIFDADIESSDYATDPTSRFEYAFNLTASSPATIHVGPLPDAMQAILTELNNHIADVANAHAADAVSFDAASLPIPAGWTDVAAATEVQGALDGIVNDLAQTDGGARIGYADGSSGWADASGIAAATISAAIDEIVDDLASSAASDGAGRIGYDNTTSGLTAADVAAALDELTSEKGNLAGGNTWTGTQIFSNAATFSSTVTANGNVDVNADLSIIGGSLLWEDGLSTIEGTGPFADLVGEEAVFSGQEAYGGTTLNNILARPYFASGFVGLVEVRAIAWENNTAEFVSDSFTAAFNDQGTIVIDSNAQATLQSTTPPSVAFSLEASGSVVEVQADYNGAGAATINYLVWYRVLYAGANQ